MSANTALVAALKEGGSLHDPAVEAAFRAVPRHLFLPELDAQDAYEDRAIPVKRAVDGTIYSSSSQPSMMALMLGQLRLQAGAHVLEIGAGTGYNAAIIQHIVGAGGAVTSIELDADLCQSARSHLAQVGMAHVQIVHGDGGLGYALNAPYDRIIATAGIWDVPRAWVEQLKPDGLIVAPILLDALQVSAAFRLQNDGALYSDDLVPCGFVLLRGEAAGPDLALRVASSSLYLVGNATAQFDSAGLHWLLSETAEECFLGSHFKAHDFWRGLLPYLTVNTPADYVFVVYALDEGQQAYGLSGHGFALLGMGSACFVPYDAAGNALCFGSADAYMALQTAIDSWNAAGRPGYEQLRLRLSPRQTGQPDRKPGRIHTRQAHNLHIWQA